MTSTLTPNDFADYIDYYTTRRRRATGQVPAASTLRTKAGHLSGAARRLAVDTPESIGELLAERKSALGVIESLRETMTSGGARSAFYTLLDYADWLHQRGICEAPALTNKDAPPQNPQGPLRTFSPSEVELLVNAARGVSLRWFGFIATLADTGRRPGEVLALEWDWAQLDSEPPHFVLPTTKTRRPQYAPLTKRLMLEVFTPENVERMKHDQSRKCQRSAMRHPFPMSYSSVNGQWVRFCQKLGLDYHGGLHALRHTRATHLLATGTPLHVVSRLLGHATSATTDRVYNATTSLTFSDYLEPDS